MQPSRMDVCHHSTAAAELAQASNPVAEKLVDMNERLDDLLLQLGDLQDNMPDADDVENLGKPHKTVKLRAPTKLAEINTKPTMQNDHHHNCQPDPVHVSSKEPCS